MSETTGGNAGKSLGDRIMDRVPLSGLFWFFLFAILWGCENTSFDKNQIEAYKRNHPSAFQVNAFINDISPDNQTLLFDYGSPYWLRIGLYNMSSGKIHVFDTGEENKMNMVPAFSRDGRKIVFVGQRERNYAGNIYIMNTDGSDLRQITNNHGMVDEGTSLVHAPAFSPDGKRIIFLRSQRTRERAYPLRGRMSCDWDIYEVDIDTGVERRLTEFYFYDASWPSYMANGKRFIFSGEGPYNPSGNGPKNYKEYEDQYRKNFIFIMDGRNNELKPALINGNHSINPHVSNDDTILFISRTNEMDGLENAPEILELFLYRKGKIKRLTTLHAYIKWTRISRDGRFIIFTKRNSERDRDFSYWLMKSDGTGLREIKIPVDGLKQGSN